MIRLKASKKLFFLFLVSLFLLSCVTRAQVNAPDVIWVKGNYSTSQKTTDTTSLGNIEVDQTTTRSSQENFTGTIQAAYQMVQFSSFSNSPSVTRHMMCKDHDLYYNPIEPTTIFRPSDTKAECLTTVSVNDKIEFKWYYRSDSSKTWVSCFNWSAPYIISGVQYYYVGWLNIAGYWPSIYYPRSYKVDVYMDGYLSFSEFFEVTNGGLNSPRICQDVDTQDGQSVNMKSRFTIGVDTRVFHYLRFDKLAYFNEEIGCCHNFTTVWIQPDGSTYKTYSDSFADYKDTNATWNYWNYNYTSHDYISINSSIPVGNWKVEVYLDYYYFNSTWMRYGPVATTPFIVGSEPVADWTVMVYLDADSNLEEAGIEIFLKMASVSSSSQVNIVVQMDRIPGYDSRYGNWTDCERFVVTENMTPILGNATLHLGEVNMGRPDTLKEFINWTINNYPANYYFLALWGHGTGCMGVCFDFTDANDALSLPEFSQALSGLPAIMDVMLLDACGMSMTEVAYQIRDYANILVGPEGLGYSPAPYDGYLLSLTSKPSMLPREFASAVVTAYIEWCKLQLTKDIPNAMMSAVDLTGITSLMAAIDDFALKLMENESFYDYLIYLARNQTEGYEGPYTSQSGYLIDLYHFAQLINQQHTLDEELKNSADQMMAALERIIIIKDHKARPNSHGLSIYFPDEGDKYFNPLNNFERLYEETSFAEVTSWDEFVKYYLDIQTNGYILTIKTPYSYVLVEVDNKSYTTDANKILKLFILPGSYSVNVSTTILTEPNSSRGIFMQWKEDSVTANPRSLDISEDLTREAEYKTQYYLTINTYPSGLTTLLESWHYKDDEIVCTAKEISGYVFDHWIVDGESRVVGVNPITVTMNKRHETTAYYVSAPPWWETLLRPDILQVVLGLVGIVITVALVVPAWFRTRRKRGIIKTFLNEVDEVYSRFKTNPQKCEEELYRLRNTILEGLTDGKITEESYNILDKRIDKYMEEIQSIMEAPAEPTAIEVSEVLPDRITTGYADLDNLLFGGIPKNYAVILTSPSCDERDLLIKRFLETGVKKGETTFYITIDPGEVSKLAEEFQSNFYFLICNPQADKIIKSLPNVFKLKSLENLTDISIALTKAFRKLDTSINGPKRACIQIISDILLQHHAVQTRKFLTELTTELKSRGFTTLAVVNPKMHPSEEAHAILDLFEGEINIYEKETKKGLEKFLKIKKMYKQRYSENEILLKKEKLET